MNSTTVDRETEIRFRGSEKSLKIIQSKYAVGDDYNEGGVSAKVTYMQDELRLVSYAVGKSAWSIEEVATGATDFYDGRKNMAIIKSIPNWKELYPAFALCDELNTHGNTEWYLPAVYEGNRDLSWSSTENDLRYAFYNERYMQRYQRLKSEVLTEVAVKRF